MQFRSEYLDRLRSCLATENQWHRVERCFREGLPANEEVDDARPIVWAFGYMLVASRRDELRERVGVFGAQWEIGGSVFPPPVAEIGPEILDLWDTYAGATGDLPLAASRINDLLWVRRHGERLADRARAAFDGYMALAESATTMDLVDCLLRAVEIAAEIKDGDRLAAAIDKALDVSRAEIAAETERRPGIPLGLLEAVIDLRPAQWPAGLGELLSDAANRYGEDPFMAQSIGELQVALAEPDAREGLQRQQVTRWREESKNGDGLLRYSRLQQALALARTHGFSEEAEEILLEMQAIKPEDFDLKSITAEVEIPREEIEAWVRSYAEDSGSWQDALRRFGSEGPPSGDSEGNEKLTKELAEKYPLQRIFTTQVMGPHGSVTVTAGGDEEHDRVDLAKHEAMQIRIWASIGVEILDAIQQAFGTPDREALMEYFTTELIDQEVASRMTDGVLRFFGSDDDSALHVLIPQLEAAIRGAAARAGVVVIKTSRGGTPGGVRSPGGILADLNGRLDESWRRYLVNSLTDSLGVNLRNQVSHGLHGPTARGDVATAIQIACHIRGWRHRVDDHGPAPASDG
jgi:hypothetical protein